ncbi:uncharacterized protein BDV17DRAFT_254947 [Aspergillus undulatus]|uniref:uncharacterized protein n=1 Tax=Aspergillus undulatus TaxID=1810928 RepID=UPI003CCCD8F5
MSPSHIMRAIQPMRSSIFLPASILYTQTSTALQCSRPAFTSRRLIASTPFRASEQEEFHEQTPRPSAVPPSLRSYPRTVKKGTVVSVGRMDRCVKVEYRHSVWDNFLRKTYPKVTTFMVSDPQNSLREGDVVEFSSGYPKGRRVHHIVERIIAPFAVPIEDRPAVLSREERDAIRTEKRAAKWARREQRRIESGLAPSEGNVHGKEHIGRIRRLVLERTKVLERPTGADENADRLV